MNHLKSLIGMCLVCWTLLLPAAGRSETVNIAGSSFRPRTTAQQYSSTSAGCLQLSAQAPSYLEHPVLLPDGAMIENFEIAFRDSLIFDNLSATLIMYRAGETETLLETISSTGFPGTSTLSSPSIDHIVDGTAEAFAVRVFFEAADPQLLACSVRVNYLEPESFF